MNCYWIRLFCLFCLAAGTVVAFAAGPDDAGDRPAATVTDDRVAVTVNGFVITEEAVETEIKPRLEQIKARSQQLPDEFLTQYKEKLRQQAIDQMIVKRLLDEQVAAAGIEVTDQQVDEQISQLAANQTPPLSREDFEELIKAYGRTIEQVREHVRSGMTYEKLMEGQFAGKFEIGQEQVADYYQQNKSQFETPEQVRASHILISPEKNTPDANSPPADPNAADAEALAKAKSLLKEIAENGADFAELAKANSACPSRERGGDLGYGTRSDPNSGRSGSWVEPFEKAAFGLQVGQVSGVVPTRFGYHIIKVTDRKPATVETLDQAAGQITGELTARKKGELAEQYIESLKESAKIVYPAGKDPTVPPPPPQESSE